MIKYNKELRRGKVWSPTATKPPTKLSQTQTRNSTMPEGVGTLADALLDDLDDLSDVEETNINDESNPPDEEYDAASANNNTFLKGEDTTSTSTGTSDKPPAVSFDWWPRDQKQLLDHRKLDQFLQTIRYSERQHSYLVESNKFLVAANADVQVASMALADAYHPKFPELEELLPDPMQYYQAVKVIGNASDLASKQINDSLNTFLSSHQIITISVAQSTTSGRWLTPPEVDRIQQISHYLDETSNIIQELQLYVESFMTELAPNMVELIGATTAAKLLSLTGGLQELSKIPSCNLQVLGQTKQRVFNKDTPPHQGILAQCDLVQQLPKSFRQKGLKTVAAKLALAIRCDCVNAQHGRRNDNSQGKLFKSQIVGKFQKLLEPDAAPVLKALPKPDLSTKKRRGGKRMRRLKARYEETALMKQANTRAFSSAVGEYGDDAMGKTMGLLDTANVGNNRTGEKKKMSYANTKASRKRARQQASAANRNSSGLASSVVFTQTQGMQLVDPDAQKRRVQEANRKWFNDSSGFQSALPKK